MPRLTIIRGLPGSGKSTYAKKNYDCLILENDMLQMADGKYMWSVDGTKTAIKMVYKMADMALANGSDVCIANTFTKKRFVNEYKMLAERHAASFEVVRLMNDFGNVHNVPSQVLESMKKGFEDWPGEKTVVC